MSQYIIEIGESLAAVLERATSAQPSQFAGYWANIEFWIAEYEHLKCVVDEYDQRYEAFKTAHNRYVKNHGGPHNYDDVGMPYQSAIPTTQRGDRERIKARVRAALIKLIERAQRMNFIDFRKHDDLVERLASS